MKKTKIRLSIITFLSIATGASVLFYMLTLHKALNSAKAELIEFEAEILCTGQKLAR